MQIFLKWFPKGFLSQKEIQGLRDFGFVVKEEPFYDSVWVEGVAS